MMEVGEAIRPTPDEIREEITPAYVKRFLRKSKAGQRMVYHVGNLAFDRQMSDGHKGNVEPRLTMGAKACDLIGKIMYEAFEMGYVHLVQAPVEHRLFHGRVMDRYYIAVRTGLPYRDPQEYQDGQGRKQAA